MSTRDLFVTGDRLYSSGQCYRRRMDREHDCDLVFPVNLPSKISFGQGLEDLFSNVCCFYPRRPLLSQRSAGFFA